MEIYAKIADDVTLNEAMDVLKDSRHIFKSIHIGMDNQISRKVFNRDMKEHAIKKMCDDNVALKD